MKRQTYLRDENLLTLLSLHDFIIPEIQREYVWGSKENCDSVLRPFMQSIKEHAGIEGCGYAHSIDNHHIGFLYSYKPQYIRDLSNRISDEYLIDGQQRFTSLFLLLLVRAVMENRMNDFCNLIRWEEETIAFDYKVRQLTHRFIYDLITHLKDNDKETLEDIRSNNCPHWFLKDYQEDMTVSNIVRAIVTIVEVFDSESEFYYDYLLTRIHFWHFKTDVTSQGEELYITMNSRGEELSSNEIQKSRRLPTDKQIEWGKKWEEWQTYFWKNRGENYDADKGFNNFLACIDAMGKYLNIDPYYSIEDIEKFVEALKFMTETKWEDELRYNKYTYTGWISAIKEDIWARINTTNAKWVIEKDSDTTQRENAVLLWPLFYYYYLVIKENKELDTITFVRLMHLCYLNYQSKKTNHAHIKDFVEALIDNENDMTKLNENWGYVSKEHCYLSKLIDGNPEIESLIWEVQDKKYFLDGEDVGGDTIIGYIKDFESNNIDLKTRLETLKQNYDIMFPANNENKNEIILKRILLHYKDDKNDAFWKQTAPYYDRNYETSSWKRIVRHGAFLNFYREISNNHSKVFEANTLNELIKEKQDKFFEEGRNRIFNSSKWSDRRLAIFFDVITEGELWIKDKNDIRTDLGFHDDIEIENSLPFIGQTRVGNRKCGNKSRWKYKEIPEGWQDKLKEMYPNYQFTF